jgi:hypothetical protein
VDDTFYPRMNAQKVEEVLVNIKAANRSKKTTEK